MKCPNPTPVRFVIPTTPPLACSLVLTTSKGHVMIAPVVPAMPPAMKGAHDGGAVVEVVVMLFVTNERVKNK